ncbi:MAG TPA: hypothetical protein VFU25_11650 [Ornithinibacter sp.]|nr:hypothetical protein [Ornithinibacter sp.]
MATSTAPPGQRLRARGPMLVVVACALVAALARLPGIGWSARPDESGFTLVARAWDPTPASPFGHYWVDRPPPLIALVRLTDFLGGVHGIRWVAVVGSALLVLAAAGVAREVARSGAPGTSDRTVVLTAIGTTALVSNAAIDLVAAKGEVLSLPLLVGSAWLVLRALRTRSAIVAAVAGLLGGTALGLKQNLVGALVFAAVLLGGEWVRRTLPGRDLVRISGAFLAGAAVPVAATVAWALAEGVSLSALWYAVFGFRADAFDVIVSGPVGAPLRRAVDIVGVGIASGLMILLLWFVLSLRRLGRERPVLTLAALAVLVVDCAALVLGGSYWRPYLFGLVPAAVLALALLASGTAATTQRPARSRVVTNAVVVVLVAGWVLSGVQWVRTWPTAGRPSTAVLVGRGIGAAAQPGDTLTVWGGRADVQLASGMASPYEHLWSLPARTRDPRSERLASVLAGPGAPTWFLAWAGLDAWEGDAMDTVGPVVRDRYVKVGTACGGHDLYRLRDEPRPAPAVNCAALRAARSATAP